jgi:hypothetical protein
MHERTLLSDDESVVSVARREQQLEQTYLTNCFLLLCFILVLFWFYFCLFVSDSSWSFIIYMCGGFFFLLAIVLPFLRFTASDYPFGIFKLF